MTESDQKTIPSRKDKLRQRLIEAAEKAIATHGLSGLKARDLAVHAGCALGAIYTVFEDLDELILRVGARTLALLETALAGEPETDADEELKRLARAYLDFARQEEPRWRALFEHRLPAGRDVPDWYAQERNKLFSLLEAPLTRLLQDEDQAQRARLARTLFAAVHGVVALGMDEKLAPTPAQTLETQLDIFVRLLAAGLALRSSS